MDQKRKEIIIKEIQYWKENHLLPDHYCDFLLTLYTEGNYTEGEKPREIHNTIPFMSSLFVSCLFIITVLIFYFTDFSFLLQITIGFFSALFILYIGQNINKKNKTFAHMYLLTGAITLFLVIIEGTSYLFSGNQIAIALAIFLSCMGWLVIGVRWKLRYFTISGATGLILLILFLIFHYLL